MTIIKKEFSCQEDLDFVKKFIDDFQIKDPLASTYTDRSVRDWINKSLRYSCRFRPHPRMRDISQFEMDYFKIESKKG